MNGSGIRLRKEDYSTHSLPDQGCADLYYASLRGGLAKTGRKWQPLHGDAHLGNVVIGDSGAIWMDLEADCLRPLEWDVVNLPASMWPQFGNLDLGLMRLFADVRSLCVALWCWAEFDRSDAAAEAAIYHLGELQRRFN